MVQSPFKFKCSNSIHSKFPFTCNLLFGPTSYSGYFQISKEKRFFSCLWVALSVGLCTIFGMDFFVGLLDQPLFQISSSANLFRVLNYISSSSCNDGVKPSQCLPTYNKSLTNQKTKGKIISTFFFELILSLQG